MAMNKAERSAFDELRVVAALRWSVEVRPDVPAPLCKEPDTTGFTFNAHSKRVEEGWSSSVYHGSGAVRGPHSSQNSQWLFSSKVLALKAMRHAVEISAAKDLARIDEQIEAAQKEASNAG